jgi:hypothetical protein
MSADGRSALLIQANLTVGEIKRKIQKIGGFGGAGAKGGGGKFRQ